MKDDILLLGNIAPRRIHQEERNNLPPTAQTPEVMQRWGYSHSGNGAEMKIERKGKYAPMVSSAHIIKEKKEIPLIIHRPAVLRQKVVTRSF